ncbi:hypothetical protein A3F29_03110 [Candidatus Roizmanbacteria bacterium RIFCSPHIGHO2_12_FULL_33_9]|uniref:Reactive intermediate/imine deaminase n=1 Tax=Candidatus Roizmanbacteria bacterium RIFCSPHIGHO2_12_FULL_33_9 TaxID=1802045 RepID=A0A1F7HFG3_9BACT|nr:MAG: hypothetical protein A3F29_03110 [Candidatus Roizmanbacteria bacterium RIFCSPHIGHO2_12_FULL_33_9]
MAGIPFSKTFKSGGFIFVSGQIGLKEGTTDLISEDIIDQTHQVMNNIKIALEEAGASIEDIVKTTIYAVDLTKYSEISDVYVSYLTEPYPAREFIGVKELPLGAKIEISVIAKKK